MSSAPCPKSPPPEHGWRSLWLLALVGLLAMALWFSAPAVLPQLEAEWRLSGAQGAWLTMSVQLLTGVTLAGVYPPGMKLMATWCREDRGLCIGLLVGALTVGSALPHLFNALPLSGAASGIPAWRPVLLVASACALAASDAVHDPHDPALRREGGVGVGLRDPGAGARVRDRQHVAFAPLARGGEDGFGEPLRAPVGGIDLAPPNPAA